MRSKFDFTGHRFGYVVATSEAAPQKRQSGSQMRRINCICDCGKEFIAFAQDIKSGNTKSCGCTKRELIAQANTTHGATRGLKQGIPAISEYHTWRGMIDRCENHNHISYKWYGARGIRVCARWRKSFSDFLADMGEKPSPDHSIDRVDGNGHYCPENCRWATAKEQFLNTEVSPEFISHIKRGRR